MEIEQFRVVVRAKSFERTANFYGKVLALPRLRSWDDERGRGAIFQAGSGAVEVLGRPREGADAQPDEAFVYQGPQHKLTLTLRVPSAERAYEELQFRERSIPGGLKHQSDGTLVFETRDPDGVKIVFEDRDRRG